MFLHKSLVFATIMLLGLANDAGAENPPPYLTQWGSFGTGPGQFNNPLDIAVDNSGNVYVADTQNHRIQKFTRHGLFLLSWGQFGANDGEFRYPQGVAADDFGHVYIADGLNNRVQKFTSNGVYLLQWNTIGVPPGQLNRPMAVATDEAGYVYVSDYANQRIYKFDAMGQYILTFDPGYGNGFYPCDGLSVSSEGLVYATAVDVPTKLINVFNTSGGYENAFGCTGGYPTPCAFSHPNDVDVDGDGNFYVVDNDWFRVVKYNSTGTWLTMWGTWGNGNGQFDQPYGIAVDRATGWIYVAEEFNHRVQVFGPGSIAVEPTTWTNIKTLFR